MTYPVQDSPASVTPSIVRTIVPFLVGLLVTWLASRGLGLDTEMQASLTTVITIMVGSVYYTVVRLVERHKPKVGILLGIAKSPTYEAVEDTVRLALENDLVQAYVREIDKDDIIDDLQAEIEGLIARLAEATAPKKRAPRKAAASKVLAAEVDVKDVT